MTNADDNIVELLWTGGWDSTYRLVELSMREGVTVSPIYVEDPNRGSAQYELKAMEEILDLLHKKEKTKATILPILRVPLVEIPQSPEITNAYLLFKGEADMGVQHDWLARLALQHPGMELCIEKALGEHAPIRNSILKHGKLFVDGDGYIVDQAHSSKELNLVLGNLKLPIFDKTEREMLENIKAWGYEDVMQHIWFCHSPIGRKPCGLCNPCSTKMDSSMEFLLPPKARERCRRKRAIGRLLGEKAEKLYVLTVRKWEGLKERKN